MKAVALRDVAAQPWRNGGGSTRELLAWPDPAAWQVRVSVAAIERDGDFSAYPGVDRWFTVLHGDGVALDLPDGRVTLGRGSDPLHFAGEAAPAFRLLGGATQDLNLMIRRGSGRGSMQRAVPGSALQGKARWRGLYAAATLTLDCDGTPQALQADTLLWSDADVADWRLPAGTAPAPAWWLLLEAA